MHFWCFFSAVPLSHPIKVGRWCNLGGKVGLLMANLGGYASGKERITKMCFRTFCHGIPPALLTSTVKKKGPRANPRHSPSAFVSFIQKPPVRLKQRKIFLEFSGKVCILEKTPFLKILFVDKFWFDILPRMTEVQRGFGLGFVLRPFLHAVPVTDHEGILQFEQPTQQIYFPFYKVLNRMISIYNIKDYNITT